MAWIIAAVILLGIGCIPVGVRIMYDAAGVRVFAVVSFLKITVFPLKKAAKNGKEKPKPDAEKKAPPAAAAEKPEPRPELSDFIPLIRIGLRALDALRRKLRFDRLELHVIMAGDDPCDLACNYGRVQAAVGNLMPALNRALTIRKQDVDIACDFMSESMRLTADVQITITIGSILGTVVYYGVPAVCEFLKIRKKKNKKAVPENE